MKKRTLPLCLSIALSCVASAATASVLPDQETAALEYRLRLTRVDAENAAERERLYQTLIENCPQTEAAEEAFWSLAGLYLDDFEEPREEEAQKTLERFLEQYPASRWVEHAENRLLWLYEGTKDRERALGLFEKILKRDMPGAVRLSMALRCAEAYEGLDAEKARSWYGRIVELGGDSPEVQTARKRLAAKGR